MTYVWWCFPGVLYEVWLGVARGPPSSILHLSISMPTKSGCGAILPMWTSKSMDALRLMCRGAFLMFYMKYGWPWPGALPAVYFPPNDFVALCLPQIPAKRGVALCIPRIVYRYHPTVYCKWDWIHRLIRDTNKQRMGAAGKYLLKRNCGLRTCTALGRGHLAVGQMLH